MGVGVIVSVVHNKGGQITAMSNAANEVLQGLEMEAPYWMGLLSHHRQLNLFAAQRFTGHKFIHLKKRHHLFTCVCSSD